MRNPTVTMNAVVLALASSAIFAAASSGPAIPMHSLKTVKAKPPQPYKIKLLFDKRATESYGGGIPAVDVQIQNTSKYGAVVNFSDPAQDYWIDVQYQPFGALKANWVSLKSNTKLPSWISDKGSTAPITILKFRNIYEMIGGGKEYTDVLSLRGFDMKTAGDYRIEVKMNLPDSTSRPCGAVSPLGPTKDDCQSVVIASPPLCIRRTVQGFQNSRSLVIPASSRRIPSCCPTHGYRLILPRQSQ